MNGLRELFGSDSDGETEPGLAFYNTERKKSAFSLFKLSIDFFRSKRKDVMRDHDRWGWVDYQ